MLGILFLVNRALAPAYMAADAPPPRSEVCEHALLVAAAVHLAPSDPFEVSPKAYIDSIPSGSEGPPNPVAEECERAVVIRQRVKSDALSALSTTTDEVWGPVLHRWVDLTFGDARLADGQDDLLDACNLTDSHVEEVGAELRSGVEVSDDARRIVVELGGGADPDLGSMQRLGRFLVGWEELTGISLTLHEAEHVRQQVDVAPLQACSLHGTAFERLQKRFATSDGDTMFMYSYALATLHEAPDLAALIQCDFNDDLGRFD